MYRSRLLILGGSSLLAVNWVVSMRVKFDIILVFHNRNLAVNGVTNVYSRFNSQEEILNLLRDFSPDIVLNATGMTNVDKCEVYPELARKVNTTLAANIAIACDMCNIRLIHISTDHLFSGRFSFSTELSPTKPLNVYANTKLEGERMVLATNCRSLLIRTNFFCWGTSYRKSFSDKIIDSLRKKQPIMLFSDVFFTPINASLLASLAHELIDKNYSGIFNISCDDKISKYEAGISLSNEFNLDSSLIVAGLAINSRPLAPRPLDMTLSNQKLCGSLLHSVGSFAHQVRILKEQESTFNMELQKL